MNVKDALEDNGDIRLTLGGRERKAAGRAENAHNDDDVHSASHPQLVLSWSANAQHFSLQGLNAEIEVVRSTRDSETRHKQLVRTRGYIIGIMGSGRVVGTVRRFDS